MSGPDLPPSESFLTSNMAPTVTQTVEVRGFSLHIPQQNTAGLPDGVKCITSAQLAHKSFTTCRDSEWKPVKNTQQLKLGHGSQQEVSSVREMVCFSPVVLNGTEMVAWTSIYKLTSYIPLPNLHVFLRRKVKV